MQVSIGFHFISTPHQDGSAILTALNNAGITVDGNSVELVDNMSNGMDLCRVWTQGTLEAFHDAADLFMAVNNGGPIMFTGMFISDPLIEKIEVVMNESSIDHHKDVDFGEVFAYCESAEHIRILCKALM